MLPSATTDTMPCPSSSSDAGYSSLILDNSLLSVMFPSGLTCGELQREEAPIVQLRHEDPRTFQEPHGQVPSQGLVRLPSRSESLSSSSFPKDVTSFFSATHREDLLQIIEQALAIIETSSDE